MVSMIFTDRLSILASSIIFYLPNELLNTLLHLKLCHVFLKTISG